MSGARKHSRIMLEVRGRDVLVRDVEIGAVLFFLPAGLTYCRYENRFSCSSIADTEGHHS